MATRLARRREECGETLRVISEGYVQVWDPDHPLATQSGWVYAHRRVLFMKIGQGVHECYWCGRMVEWRGVRVPKSNPADRGVIITYAPGRHRVDMAATAKACGAVELVTDHLNGNTLDNRPENVVASCRTCNKDRGLASNPLMFGGQTFRMVFAQVVATIREARTRALGCLRRDRTAPYRYKNAPSPVSEHRTSNTMTDSRSRDPPSPSQQLTSVIKKRRRKRAHIPSAPITAIDFDSTFRHRQGLFSRTPSSV